MRGQDKVPVSDRMPYMLMGLLCWLCGAVVIGIGVQLLVGNIAALVAVAVVTLLVLCMAWRLSSLSLIHMDPGGKK
jgi:hypothetical protein